MTLTEIIFESEGDGLWTTEQRERLAEIVNSSTDHLQVIDLYNNVRRYPNGINNLMLLHKKIKRRVADAIRSQDYQEMRARNIKELEKKSFVTQIKLPGET